MCECECLYVTTRAMFYSLDKNVKKKNGWAFSLYFFGPSLERFHISIHAEETKFQSSFNKVLNSYVKKK